MTLAQGDKTAEYKDVLVNMEGYVLFVFLHFPKVPPLHTIPTDNGIKRDIRIYLRDRKVYNGGTLVTELLLCESPPTQSHKKTKREGSALKTSRYLRKYCQHSLVNLVRNKDTSILIPKKRQIYKFKQKGRYITI